MSITVANEVDDKPPSPKFLMKMWRFSLKSIRFR